LTGYQHTKSNSVQKAHNKTTSLDSSTASSQLHPKPPLPQILIWNLEIGEPVKMIDCHTDVILSMSFNTDGSLLATSCKDKKLRVIEPRSGAVLQVSGQGAGVLMWPPFEGTIFCIKLSFKIVWPRNIRRINSE